MSRFRNFLYIDLATVEGFLSGIEGGSYDETEETVSGVTAESSDPARITSERRRTVRETPGARFSRLWKEISTDPDEKPFEFATNDSGDLDVWEEAQYGRFCRFTGDLSVPTILSALSAVDDLRNFLQMGNNSA